VRCCMKQLHQRLPLPPADAVGAFLVGVPDLYQGRADEVAGVLEREPECGARGEVGVLKHQAALAWDCTTGVPSVGARNRSGRRM